jgi:RNA polymerase sigma-70 factor (ECF subfamily)
MVGGQAPGLGTTHDETLVSGLRAGDETVFAELVDRYGETMLKVASGVVASAAVAEEVVQETWLAVFTGIHRFEGRSSLRTWIFRILMNTANTIRVRDARVLPFSDLARELSRELSEDEPAVDPERFLPASDARWPGHWSARPRPWEGDPERQVLASETLAVIGAALETLPAGQRAVVLLRDFEGWSAEEVSEALDLSRGNQRVLLHRARSRLRAALEEWMQTPAEARA